MQLRKEVVLFDLRFLPGHGWHVSLNLMYGHVGPSPFPSWAFSWFLVKIVTILIMARFMDANKPKNKAVIFSIGVNDTTLCGWPLSYAPVEQRKTRLLPGKAKASSVLHFR